MNINDLLIEYDEMGMSPTTVCESPEQFAIDWREKVREEFECLTAENDKLRARLGNAVELPCIYNTFSDKRQKCYGSWYVLKKTDHGSFVFENCGTEERAKIRLEEIKAEAKLKEQGGE